MVEQTLFDADETLTVGQLTRRLNDVVRRAFPHEVWIEGQIRNLSRSQRGHVYFDLVDPVAAGAQPKASVAVTLFDSNRQIVNRIIKRTGNAVRIDDGVEVRIRAAIDFYPPKGQLQLNMTSIDPEFTLGRLGADRELLLQALRVEQLIDANAAVPMPLVPLRVALITSASSAAEADFVDELGASRFAFEITTLATRVQGEFAPEEIAAAIVAAGALEVDVVALVRGGGARTDLAAFDTEPVARAIATSPRPVMCGIGHEVDSSVADIVSHLALKTPTACAQHLVDCVDRFDSLLVDATGRLAASARRLPELHRIDLDGCARRLSDRMHGSLDAAATRNRSAAAALERRVARALARADHRLVAAQATAAESARRALAGAARRCTDRARSISRLPMARLRDSGRDLDVFHAQLRAVDPQHALRRGYSITTDASGMLLRSAHDADPGDAIVTRLADGTVSSTVTGTSPGQPEQETQ